MKFLSTETDGIAPVRAIGAEGGAYPGSVTGAGRCGCQLRRKRTWQLDDWIVVDTGTKIAGILRMRQDSRERRTGLTRSATSTFRPFRTTRSTRASFKRTPGLSTARSIPSSSSSRMRSTPQTKRIVPILLGKKGKISEYVSARILRRALYYGVARAIAGQW